MVAAVIVAMVFITALIGDAGQGWAERGTLTAVLFTGLWSRRRGRGGRRRRLAGGRAAGRPTSRPRASPARSGPCVLIVLVSVAALGGDGASPATIVVEGIVEAAAAVAGADALARRLEAGW